MPANNYIRAIERTLRVVESFETDQELSLTELTARAHMVKSSVFRILFTLKRLAYVEKTPSGKYFITQRFGQLTQNGRAQAPAEISSLVQPFMQDLLHRYTETVNFGVLDGDKVLYIKVLESPHAFRMTAQAGITSPLHSTALGKCLICQHSRSEVERLIGKKPLQRFTTRTICDRSLFIREIERVRKRGYAVDDMEDSLGARCLGVPILDSRGKVTAALSISGPGSRINRARAREILDALLTVSQQISKLMGFTSDQNLLGQAGD
ncbi:MAG: IclR family transcriptional regulator [Candidatus Acidiferrales bacterium]